MDGERGARTALGESVMAQISREMVGLYKEQFGRGPTKARTDFAGAGILICTLEDSLTPAERTMVALGEHQRLRDMRLFFQHAAEAQFREIVERLTGRRVRAFISGLDTEEDVSCEIFVFEPLEDGADGKAPGASVSLDGDGGTSLA
jgi:uncharacterized protein YbcI